MAMDILDDRSLGGRRSHDPASALLEQDEFSEIIAPSQLRRSGRRRHTEAELNITSFVDVLSVLLFLLSVATMSKLGTHDVNLPQQTDDFTKESEVEVKNLSLSLAKGGLKLRGMLTPKDKEPEVLAVEIPLVTDGNFDLQKLRDELLRLKSGYKTDDAIILLVADDVPFDSIVKVMDTVREQVGFADGRRNITNLFPQISLSDYLLDRVDQQIAAAPPEKS